MSNSSLSELSNLSSLFEECQGSYYSLGKEIVENLSLYGLGVMPKSDIEGLFFHCICNVIEKKYYDAEVLNSENFYELNNNYVKDLDYVLMKLLKISPSKLRSLRVTRSAKFLNDLDYKQNTTNKNRLRLILSNTSVESDDMEKGRIKISISDPHNQVLIERIIEDNKSVVDKSINPKLLVLTAKQFMSLVNIVYDKDNNNNVYDIVIENLKKDARLSNEEINKENLFDKLKNFGLQEFVKIVVESLILLR